MLRNELVRVPVHYDMWMRGETTANWQRSYAMRSGPNKGRVIAILRGVRSNKLFRVWLDDLEAAQ